MSTIQLNYNLDIWFSDAMLCQGLHELGCKTVGDVMHLPLNKLISNKKVLKGWRCLTDVMVSNMHLLKGE